METIVGISIGTVLAISLIATIKKKVKGDMAKDIKNKEEKHKEEIKTIKQNQEINNIGIKRELDTTIRELQREKRKNNETLKNNNKEKTSIINVTKIGEYFHINASHVNRVFEELGYIEKKGKWWIIKDKGIQKG